MKTKILISTMLLMSVVFLQAQTVMNVHQSNGTVLQIPINTIDSITYNIPNPGNLSTLTTLPVENITEASVATGGDISSDGGSPITQRGVVWSTNINPTTADNLTNNGTGTGSFTSEISGLTETTTYYMRAYATNSAGTSYGNQVSFITTAEGGIITNSGAGITFNGYNYSSIVLGNGQEWMAENLRTTVYANGEPIPNVTDNIQWSNLTTGAWAHYNNDIQYENTYGKLYNWYTVDDSRNVCPTNWHVPTDAEWTLLTDYLGTQPGGKLKSTGTQFWLSPNYNATNESNLSSLPGGLRYDFGSFEYISRYCIWWSSTADGADTAWNRGISYDGGGIGSPSDYKTYGFSIRCIKD